MRSASFSAAIIAVALAGAGCGESPSERDTAETSATNPDGRVASSTRRAIVPANAESSASPSASTVAFQWRPNTAGAKLRTISATKMHTSFDDKTTDIIEETKKDRTIEFLAAPPLVKLKVSYPTWERSITKQGKVEHSVALKQSAFIAEKKADTWVVTDERGRPATKQDQDAVIEDCSQALARDPVVEALVSKARVVGATLVDVAEALPKKFGGPNREVKDGRFVLVSLGQEDGHDIATLEFSMRVVVHLPNGVVAETHYTGTWRVRPDDVDVGEVSTSGPITMSGVAGGGGSDLQTTKTTR